MTDFHTRLWSALSVDPVLIPDGFTVHVYTDVPCHLWLYWSPHEPWLHRTSSVLRGLTAMTEAYWCFIERYAIEQHEVGDTLFHTFTWTPWASCNTRWYLFHGNIAGSPSPSQSPIFELHFPWYCVQPPLTFDGHATGRGSPDYPPVHYAMQADHVSWTGFYFWCGQRKIGTTFTIWRSYLPFVIPPEIPVYSITAAIFELPVRYYESVVDFYVHLSDATGVSNPLILTDYRLMLDKYVSLGAISTSGWPQGYMVGHKFIYFNQTGIRFLRETHTPQLSLFSSRDVDIQAPWAEEYMNIWSAEQGYIAAPKLHLFFTKEP